MSKNKNILDPKLLLGSLDLALSSVDELDSEETLEIIMKMGVSLKPDMDFLNKLKKSNVHHINKSDGADEKVIDLFDDLAGPGYSFNIPKQKHVIKVVGIGGCGGNSIDYLHKRNLGGIDFIKANTDAQALEGSDEINTILLGSNQTRGLGAGANPDVGRQAALEDRNSIAEELNGADIVFLAAGMGGGTGTGAASIFAEIAKDLGALVIAIVTTPFDFENRSKISDVGVMLLKESADSLISIPNQKLIEVMGLNANIQDTFNEVNFVLEGAIRNILELVTDKGMINVDFADVRTVFSEGGNTILASGESEGINRAEEATKNALGHPFLEHQELSGARGILVNITASDFTLGEVSKVGELLNSMASNDANIVMGMTVDDKNKDVFKVTLLATGINENVPYSNDDTPSKIAEITDIDDFLLFNSRSRFLKEIPQSAEYEDKYDLPAILIDQYK